jgi:Family of unknown function (DUF6445)
VAGAGSVIDIPIDRRRLAINKRSRLSIDTRNVGGAPVFVVDHLFEDPGYVRALALQLDFGTAGGLYPGAFASVSIHHTDLLDLLNELLTPVIGRPVKMLDTYTGLTFAVVTAPGSELKGLASVPHCDGFCEFAGVIYLNLPEQVAGGTSFWRHRSTGLPGIPAPTALVPDGGHRRA